MTITLFPGLRAGLPFEEVRRLASDALEPIRARNAIAPPSAASFAE